MIFLAIVNSRHMYKTDRLPVHQLFQFWRVHVLASLHPDQVLQELLNPVRKCTNLFPSLGTKLSLKQVYKYDDNMTTFG